MNFHLKKCKVLSVNYKPSPFSGIFPEFLLCFEYFLGQNPLLVEESEKDLGVLINVKFNFNDHCTNLISKANQKFGLTKRTCSFVNDITRRRVLYLTLVRSQFEHCSPIWRPSSKTVLDKFEAFQKKCIKWILNEVDNSYFSYSNYIRKCREVSILPLAQKFDLNDLVLFHKIVYHLIPIELPQYLSFYDGNSRLRSCHHDKLSFICTLQPKGTSTELLDKSFFYRTHSSWNHLPLDIREITCNKMFKNKVTEHLWSQLLLTTDDPENVGHGDFELLGSQ